MKRAWRIRGSARIGPPLLAFALAATVLENPCWARTWYVKLDGTGDRPTIQAALNAAQAGDDVLLAPGTYTRTNQSAPEESMLLMKAGVLLHGEGGAAVTILDALGRGRVLLCQDVGENTRIEGLTIQGGNLGLSSSGREGAGICVLGNSNPTIANCTLSGNWIRKTGARGGALFCDRAVVEDCTIRDNLVESDGGDAEGAGVFCGAATIIRCTFTNNVLQGYSGNKRGAGLCSSSATVLRCAFDHNSCASFGRSSGGAMFESTMATIDSCTFSNNEVTSDDGSGASGGAVKLGPGVGGRIADCVFTQCAAWANTGGWGQGGAIHAEGAVAIQRCSLLKNSATMSIPAEAIGTGGAIYSTGGGLIEQCTLLQNTASGGELSPGVGGIHTDGVVRGVILAGTPRSLACSGSGTWVCCNLFQNERGNSICGTDGGGNFSADPLFCAVDPAGSMNVSLRSDSPCAPGHHPPGAESCNEIGAGAVACGTSPVQPASWNAIKRRFR